MVNNERGLPSFNPVDLELPDTNRVRTILEAFADRRARHVEVFNEYGDVTQLLQGLAVKYGLDVRFVDLGRVNSLEDVHREMGFKPKKHGYAHTDVDSPNVNFVINGLDGFILGNSRRFTPFRDLDAAMQPLTIAALYAGVIVITHTEDAQTYERNTKDKVYEVIQQSHWLSEFLWRRFHVKEIE